jgi:hypothetical protein
MSEHDDGLELDPATPDLAHEPFMVAMLSAYREEEDMPTDAKARVQRRLESAPATAASTAAASGAPGSRTLWIGLAAAAAVIAAIIVVPRLGSDASEDSGSSAQYQDGRLPPSERAVQPAVERDASPDAEIPGAVVPVPDDASSLADDAGPGLDADAAPEPAPRLRPKAGAGSRHAPPSAPPATNTEPALSAADSLAEETALLRLAQASLSGGEPRSALSTLREHKQRFPDGVLAQERRALSVVALCDDGQVERGRQEARAFLAKHPGSALRERVAAACPEAAK